MKIIKLYFLLLLPNFLLGQGTDKILVGTGYLTSNQMISSIKIEGNADGIFFSKGVSQTFFILSDLSPNNFDFGYGISFNTVRKNSISLISTLGKMSRDAWWMETSFWTEGNYLFESTKIYKEKNGDKNLFAGLGVSISRCVGKRINLETVMLFRTTPFSFPHTWHRMDIGINIYYKI